MENDLARAQHYRHLADAMRKSAHEEKVAKRQQELLDLASQYEKLADKLIGKRASTERDTKSQSKS